MARLAVQDGIDTVVATPHCFNGVYFNTRTDILEACRNLNHELKESGIPLDILPSSEVHFCPEISTALENDELMTVNDMGKHLLLELPDPFFFRAVQLMLSKLVDQHITPIIAHPERNFMIQRNTALLSDFLQLGAMSQITASSLIGFWGPASLKCTVYLLKMDMVHVVGSDAHSPDFRSPELKRVHTKIAAQFGMEKADWIMRENPDRIIRGLDVKK